MPSRLNRRPASSGARRPAPTSRSRHLGASRQSAVLIALLLAAVCGWATIPFGSASRWSQSLLFLLAVAVTATHKALRPPSLASAPPLSPVERGVLVLLTVWIVLQSLPWPRSVLGVLQPLAARDLALCPSLPSWLPPAAEPDAIPHSLALWFSYGLLLVCARRRLASRTALIVFAYAVASIGTLQALWALTHRVSPSGHGHFWSERLIGTFPGSNALGGFLVLTLLVTTGLLLRQWGNLELAHNPAPLRTKWGRASRALPRFALLITAILVQTLALMLSGSRASVLSGIVAALALALWFVRRPHAHPQQRLPAWVLASGILATTILLSTGGALLALSTRFQAMMASDSSVDLGARWSIWLGTFRLCVTHPLGVGPGGFPDAFLRFQQSIFSDLRVYHAHSDWLQALAELGLPGALLALCLVALVARHLKPLLVSRSGEHTVWVARAMLLAVLAALAHATVDFNLSSRPAITALVFCLVGAAWGTCDRLTSHVEPTPSPVSPTPRKPAARTSQTALALLALVLVAIDLRGTIAALMLESACVAMGQAPSPYQWIPPLPCDPASAEARGATALRLSPRSGDNHYQLALASLDSFRERRDALAAAPPTGANPQTWPHEVDLALRQDQLALYCRVSPMLDTAASLSPWDADIWALHGKLQLFIAAAGNQPPLSPATALHSLDYAAALAPADPFVLQRLCSAIEESVPWNHTAPWASAARQRLWIWGRRAFAIPSVDLTPFCLTWRNAGLPLLKAIQFPEASDDCLFTIYNLEDQARHGRRALLTIDRMHQRLEASAPAPATRSVRKQTSPIRSHRWLSREFAKWALRRGAWQDYREQEPLRQRAFLESLQPQLEPILAHSSAGSTVTRLALEDLELRYGLDPNTRLHLCRLEAASGNDGLASTILTELALSDDATTQTLLESDDLAFLPPQTTGRRLVDIRLAARRGETTRARSEMQAILNNNAIPYRFTHRANLLLAEWLLAEGERNTARQLLQTESARWPSAPEPALALLRHFGPAIPVTGSDGIQRRVLDLLPDCLPPIRINTSFLGGAISLTGIRLTREPRTSSSALLLSTYWSFAHRVPSDLIAVAQILNPDDTSAHSSVLSFAGIHPVAFGSGEPVSGPLLRLDHQLPASPTAPQRIRLYLRDNGAQRIISSDDGLSTIDLWNAQANLLTAPGPATGLVVTTHLTPQDPDNDFDLRLLGEDGYAVRGRHPDRIAVLAASPAGLHAASTALQGAIGRERRLLPDLRFLVSTPEPWEALTLPWSLTAPAFHTRVVMAPPSETYSRWLADNNIAPDSAQTAPSASHNLATIFDPAHDFATHPDWYPQIGAARTCPTNTSWQPCLSAAGLAAHAATAARTFFDATPAPATFSLGINDSTRWCECEPCRQLAPPDERDIPADKRWWSDPYWSFVNTVAEQVARTHPSRRLSALAYGAVLEPPPFRLHDNVFVWLCQDAVNRFDPAYRNEDDRILHTWCDRVRLLGRYDYGGLATWIYPRYGADEFIDGMRAACAAGVQAYRIEDHASFGLDGGQMWLIAQALNNPWPSTTELETSFCELAFGPAAATMQTYFRQLHTLWTSPGQAAWLGGFRDLPAQARRYPQPVLAELLTLLNRAALKANNHSDIQARLDALRTPIERAAQRQPASP